MANIIKAFIAPHIEEKYALCQDRFYINTDKLFFSVSDGVSSSLFPTYYAKLISSYYDNNQVSLSKTDAERIFGLWKSYMDDLLQKGKLGRGTSQRYKRGETPSATYGRFDIKKDLENKWRWNVAVLGDCSILHLNIKENGFKPIHVILSGKKFQSDAYKYKDDATYYKFGKLPDQLNSTGDFLENEALFTETLKTNDVFLLMTDGISDWLLGNQDKIEDRIKLLLQLNSQLEFIQLVENERSNNAAGREMENDDISLVVLRFDDIENDIIFQPKQMCVTDIDQRIEMEKEFKHRGIGFIRELKEKIAEKEKECVITKNEMQKKINDIGEINKGLGSANKGLQGKNKELEAKNKGLDSVNKDKQVKTKEHQDQNTETETKNQKTNSQNDSERENINVRENDVLASDLEDPVETKKKRMIGSIKKYGVYIILLIIVVLQIITLFFS